MSISPASRTFTWSSNGLDREKEDGYQVLIAFRHEELEIENEVS